MSKGRSVYIKSKRLGADYELASNNNNFIKGLFLFPSALRETTPLYIIAGREPQGGVPEILDRCVPPWVLPWHFLRMRQAKTDALFKAQTQKNDIQFERKKSNYSLWNL